MPMKRASIFSSSSHRNIRRAALALAVASTSVGGLSSIAHAANGSWTGAATPDTAWSNPLNWDTVPGANNGTFVSPDIATFADTTNGNNVTVDLNRNVLGMTFNTTAAVS